MLVKIAAALVTLLTLALNRIIISRGPPFTHMHLFRDVLLLLTANVLIWLAQRDDWSMQTRAQLFGAGWIWLVVQFGCSVYLVNSGV